MIKKLISKMIQMKDSEWGLYAFSRDPLGGKLSPEEKLQFAAEASQSGADLAKDILGRFGKLSVKDILSQFHLKLNYRDTDGIHNYIVFAQFRPPNEITVFNGTVEKTRAFIKEEKLDGILDGVDVEDVLLAHELFHYLEEQNPELYTKKKKIQLWRLGPIRYHSGLIALSEIAAMSFTRELLQLNYNPYVFDGLILLPHDREKALGIIEELLNFRTPVGEAEKGVSLNV